MTVIVGYIDKINNQAIIGGDSASSNDYIIHSAKQNKVFSNGDFIFGCTTSYRMIQLLQYQLEIPQVDREDMFGYMVTKFVPAVKKIFKEEEFEKENKGGNFVVGYGSSLFEIQKDYSVQELDYYAVGCGNEYAYGALNALHYMDLAAEYKVEAALGAAIKSSPGCQGPITILKTKI